MFVILKIYTKFASLKLFFRKNAYLFITVRIHSCKYKKIIS